MQAVIDRLITGIAPNGQADLLSELAASAPMVVICELLGIPESDGAAFQDYTRSLMTPNDPNRPSMRDAVTGMYMCLVGLIERKRAEPADDLLSAMIAARDGEDRLTENELMSLVFLILWPGFETTVHLISNGIAALLSEPRLAELVRAEPDPHTPRMAALVEELLRRDGPALNSIRRFPKCCSSATVRNVSTCRSVTCTRASDPKNTQLTGARLAIVRERLRVDDSVKRRLFQETESIYA